MPHGRDAVRNLLEALLQRERAESGGTASLFAVYRVDDIDLPEVDGSGGVFTLRDAFLELSHSTTESSTELEKLARKMYLKHLAAKRPE